MAQRALMFRFCVLAIMLALLSGSVGCARFMAPRSKLKPSVYNLEGVVKANGEYVIGPRDELEIAVFKCPELRTIAIVRAEDGNITMPLIGDVKASNLTPQQLADAISEKMAYFVKDPRVAVRVNKFGDKKVFLFGQVMRAGAFRLEKGDRILDLLGNSGGFNDNAMKSGAYIVRGGYYDSRIIRVNLARLIHQGDMTQNVFLENGDLVYIPEQEIENLNYALRKIFPSMYFAEQLNNLKQNIMTGGYDWYQVWGKMSGNGSYGYGTGSAN